MGHYRTAFCSGPTGTRVGDNWLISSFEVGDAHVSVQNGSEESVVGVSQGYGHPDTESKARFSTLMAGNDTIVSFLPTNLTFPKAY